MSLLRDASATLAGQSIPHALIGAAAMAIHGVSRATADVDLFTTDRRALDRPLWEPFARRGAMLRLLRGDSEDSLAGSVRLAEATEVVDVVVGRYAWEREQVETAVVRSLGELEVRVMQPAGLVLLKLHAGGPKDMWDIRSLIEVTSDLPALVAEVERTLPRLPADARALWARVRDR